MNFELLVIPGTALVRAACGWAENAFKDGKIDFLEWKKLGETLIRMGVPMVALVFGLQMPVGLAAGLVTLFDIVLTKFHKAKK